MSALLPIVFAILIIAGWRMWDAAGPFEDAFRALAIGATGVIGLAGCAIWWAC